MESLGPLLRGAIHFTFFEVLIHNPLFYSCSVKVERSSIGKVYQDEHECSGHFIYSAVFISCSNSIKENYTGVFNVNVKYSFL